MKGRSPIRTLGRIMKWRRSGGHSTAGKQCPSLFNRFNLLIENLAGVTINGHVHPVTALSLDHEAGGVLGVCRKLSGLGHDVDHHIPDPGLPHRRERPNGGLAKALDISSVLVFIRVYDR